ncbi:MAG: hypothetical protein AAF726_16105, partial [Planctomycetota bacterium]
MSARLLALALAVAACSAPPANETVAAPVVPRDALTIDRLLARPSLTGTSPSSPAWSPDSRRLAFLWSDSGASRREVWLVERDGADLRRLTGESEDASSVSGFAWLPDARGVVYLRSGSLWRSTIAGESTRLTSAAGSASSLAISPDGRFASFLRDGDLWLFEIATGTLTQATDVGEPSISSL